MTKEKAIKMNDVHVRFGDNHVLKGINLEVEQGEIIGYIGPNGAGKSTTIKLILGLIDTFEGDVEVFGKSIRNAGSQYKRRIGYVPESADLYDQLTACEYLTFIGELYGLSREEAEQKAHSLIEQFEMLDVFHQQISAFSKGMRQKVLIISSLLHNPDIIFLDEPLNGLDANSVIIMKEIFRKLAQEGKTIFYSSHIMEVVENISNRILILAEGAVIADDSFENLKEQSQQGSLEGIFNQLTGFETHEDKVEEFISIVTNGEVMTDE